jgi:hypothetical protein
MNHATQHCVIKIKEDVKESATLNKLQEAHSDAFGCQLI